MILGNLKKIGFEVKSLSDLTQESFLVAQMTEGARLFMLTFPATEIYKLTFEEVTVDEKYALISVITNFTSGDSIRKWVSIENLFYQVIFLSYVSN